MIVVTGATGALNGATVEHLLGRVAPEEIVAVTREPARAQHLADRGVQVRQGDYAAAASLPAAFEGADQLLLVSSNTPGVDHAELHGAAIGAAASVGVGRVLYTSHQGAALETPFHPGRTHARTEELLAASGLAWTSLRNGFYAHSIGWLLGDWVGTGQVRVPADGPVSWTAREDAAEAAALIVLSDGAYDGPVTLTAPDAPTFAELTAEAGALSGREIGFEVVDPQTWVAEQDNPRADFMLGMFEAAQQGFFAGTDPLLGRLLGRAPRAASEVLAAALA